MKITNKFRRLMRRWARVDHDVAWSRRAIRIYKHHTPERLEHRHALKKELARRAEIEAEMESDGTRTLKKWTR